MTTIVTTDEFAAWYRSLPEEQQVEVDYVVDRLEADGIAIRFPYASRLQGTRNGIFELRVQSRRFPIRVYAAWNPIRQAVLLIAGTKKGAHDERSWTKEMAATADRVMDAYLAERAYEADRPYEEARRAEETKRGKR